MKDKHYSEVSVYCVKVVGYSGVAPVDLGIIFGYSVKVSYFGSNLEYNWSRVKDK